MATVRFIPEDDIVIDFLLEYASTEGITASEIAKEIGVTNSDLSAYNSKNSSKKIGVDRIAYIRNQIKTVFEEQFEKYLASKNPEGFDIYIYYYFSREGVVRPALMKIAVDNDNWSTKNGEIVYFSVKVERQGDKKKNKITERRFVLNLFNKILSAPDGEPQVAFFTAINEKRRQVNFFTVNVKGLSFQDRQILFLTYSVVESQNYKLSCGFGILTRINAVDAEKLARDLIVNMIDNSVPDWIVNALHDKKMTFGSFERDAYKTEDELLEKHLQYKASKDLAGIYRGYFLSNAKMDNDGEFSNLIKIILEVLDSGEIKIYYQSGSHGSESPRYSGFLTFPKDEYGFITGCFAFYKKARTYRFNFVLESTHHESSGVLSGWTQSGFIYSTPIYFNRLKNSNLIEVIRNEKPRRFKKEELSNTNEELKKVLDKLTKLTNEYMPSISNLLI